MKFNNLFAFVTRMALAIMLMALISGLVGITMDKPLLHAKNECHDTRTDCLPE